MSATLNVEDGFVLVCRVDELAVGQPAAAEVAGRRLAIVRTDEHSVHAVDDTCTHANVSLSEGEVDGCTLECWLHGSRFDLRTGLPSGPPATIPVAVHAVRIVDGDVYVSALPASAGGAPATSPQPSSAPVPEETPAS